MPKRPANKTNPELNGLAEQVGSFIEYWGFKRVHGKIWAHLFLAREPLDAGELRARLKVSKALISMSLRELIQYEVIRERGKGPKNTLVYEVNTDCTQVVVNVLRKRERRMLSEISASLGEVRDLSTREQDSLALDADRIKTLGQMIQKAVRLLEMMISAEGLQIFD